MILATLARCALTTLYGRHCCVVYVPSIFEFLTMNHVIPRIRLRQSVIMPPIHLPLQRWLKQHLPNMHAWHPVPEIGRSIIFNKVLGLLLGNHACAGAGPLPWPTEKNLTVAVSRCNGIAQA